MTQTIGNPLSWLADATIGAGRSAGEATNALRGTATTPPAVQALTRDDLATALRKGVADFTALRSDVIFLIAIYPIIGIALSLWPSTWPACRCCSRWRRASPCWGRWSPPGLYEMSRTREATGHAGWGVAFSVLRARVIVPVVVLGLVLMGLFVIWMFAATLIYNLTLGPQPPASIASFASDVFTTGAGWAMIVLGMGVGLAFAAAVLVVSFISFPMLIDRRAGIPVAVMTSIKVARANPRIVATWGLIVAVTMVLGTLPAFLGLMIVLPILGHATWHLYRIAVPATPEDA